MQSEDHKFKCHHADNECLLDLNRYTDGKLDAAQIFTRVYVRSFIF